jgi:hypothetical protein
MTREEVERFIKVQSQMEELNSEIGILSKKSPNDPLNEFKLQFVNDLLGDANKFLGDKYKPFKEFSSFDESKMPSNSDVVMILSQYLRCLENLRCDNIAYELLTGWYWVINGKKSDIQTKSPNTNGRR